MLYADGSILFALARVVCAVPYQRLCILVLFCFRSKEFLLWVCGNFVTTVHSHDPHVCYRCMCLLGSAIFLYSCAPPLSALLFF